MTKEQIKKASQKLIEESECNYTREELTILIKKI